MYPKWGSWQVGRITRTVVREWVAEMEAAGAGRDLREKSLAILKHSLEYAVEAHFVAENPATKISLGKKPAPAPNIYLYPRGGVRTHRRCGR